MDNNGERIWDIVTGLLNREKTVIVEMQNDLAVERLKAICLVFAQCLLNLFNLIMLRFYFALYSDIDLFTVVVCALIINNLIV